MTDFTSRGQSAEKGFIREKDVDFRIKARRNRFMGAWAAEKQGLKGSKAEEYIREVLFSDLEEPGDEDIIEKLTDDFRHNGLDLLVKEIRPQLEKAYKQAAQEWDDENT